MAGFKGTFRIYSERHLKKGIPTGWSAVGGQTSSPYVKGGFEAGGDPIGSSGGSAVGLCAGFGVGAIGTDTTGSVVSLPKVHPHDNLLTLFSAGASATCGIVFY